MVSTHPPISKTSSPLTNLLMTTLCTPRWTCITVTIIFHSFFRSLARCSYLTLFSLSFHFSLWSAWTANSTIRQVFFLLLTITRSGRLAWIRWSNCIPKSRRSLCVSFSRNDSSLRIYHLFIFSNLIFLHNSQWITFPLSLFKPYTLFFG